MAQAKGIQLRESMQRANTVNPRSVSSTAECGGKENNLRFSLLCDLTAFCANEVQSSALKEKRKMLFSTTKCCPVPLLDVALKKARMENMGRSQNP